jgi:hypothetical protein
LIILGDRQPFKSSLLHYPYQGSQKNQGKHVTPHRLCLHHNIGRKSNV